MNNQDLRPVVVTTETETFKGFFHGWTQRIGEYWNEREEQLEYVYKVAIIEKEGTGQIFNISPENIRFTDR